jgi:hypothetical protein
MIVIVDEEIELCMRVYVGRDMQSCVGAKCVADQALVRFGRCITGDYSAGAVHNLRLML